MVVGRARERAGQPVRRTPSTSTGPAATPSSTATRAGAGPRRPLRPGAGSGRAGRRRATAARSPSATSTTSCRSRRARSTSCSAAAAVAAGSDELASLATAFGHLPHATDTDPAAVAERHRDKELLRERLAALVEPASPRSRPPSTRELVALNARPRRARRAAQRAELPAGVWRTASEELDYRRFFDIESLVGLRVEDPTVFAATHAPDRRAGRGGARSTGCGSTTSTACATRRVPRAAARAAPAACRSWWRRSWRRARSCPAWPVAGTTGYDFARPRRRPVRRPAPARRR